jgi:nucleoside phosphorylase
VSRIPVYFSHSYRREDRDVNDHFWHIFYDADFSFTVDPGTTSFFPTTLELMMARSVGFAAVVTFRGEEERYQCSPFIVYEYGLAVQAQRPRLVLLDKRVPPRSFRAKDTLAVEFDVANLDRCTDELKQRLDRFRTQAAGRMGHPYRRGQVGVAIRAKSGKRDASARARYAYVQEYLSKLGSEPVDLAVVADDPWELAEAADACDFAVVDIDDTQMSGIADFLMGRGTPLLKMARRGTSPIEPERLLGSTPLRRATAADELVMYWTDHEDFESRVGQQISRAMIDRTEFTDLNSGHTYFRSLGREAQPVFVSNAGAADDIAKDLADALSLENIPFFHYRYQNTIGAGKLWNDQLERMVTASKVFLPLIDEAYWKSEYCRKEYEIAVRLADHGRLIIFPCLLKRDHRGPEVPYQGTDLYNRPRQEQIGLVVERLDNLLAATGETAATSKPGPLKAGQISVDVAIITILQEEYKAVLGLLRDVRPVVGSPELENNHVWVVGEVDSPLSDVPYTVGLAKSPAGTNEAVNTTKNTLEALHPRCVLVVGVAGGLGDVSLGDVVVADRICAYEYGKVDHGFHSRDDLDSPTDAGISSAASTLPDRYPDWYGELARSHGLRDLHPRIIVGHVASGDKVVDDPTAEFFASVIKSRRKLQAVEMEGAGVATAIQNARETQHAVSFGMVRGISDIPRVGGSRQGSKPGVSGQTEMRDSWKVPAASSAAAAAVQLIRLSWPRQPRAESQQ